jgi:hypothetical protein
MSKVWRSAWRRRFVLVTADEDFWGQRRHLLRDIPGLLLFRGRIADNRLEALARAMTVMDLRAELCLQSRLFIAAKVRVSAGRRGVHGPGSGWVVVEDALQGAFRR